VANAMAIDTSFVGTVTNIVSWMRLRRSVGVVMPLIERGET